MQVFLRRRWCQLPAAGMIELSQSILAAGRVGSLIAEVEKWLRHRRCLEYTPAD